MLKEGDTICAVATGTGGGIGIIRISGPDAVGILAKLLVPWPNDAQTHRLYRGAVKDAETGALIDEALACVMFGPHSYTGEDVAEIHGHGNPVGLARVMRAVVRAGGRVAEPGEFTRRAFLNGRVDLTEAEAIADVISAQTERALEVAQRQLRGSLREVVGLLRRELVEVAVELEGRVDFPDERLDFIPEAEVAITLSRLADRTRDLAGPLREED